MGYIKVDSKEIYIEAYGKENEHTIVYFHGGPGAGCSDFRQQAKILGKNYHVIIFDQYGCWRSEAISENEPFGMTDHVKLIDKMREILDIQSWIVLGHSYGGMLACLYAHTYPEYTKAVIYECPSWDFILSAKSIAAFLIPYFTRINSEEGLINCHELINKSYINRCNAINDILAILNMVEYGKERNYIHGISIEEFDKYSYDPDLPDNNWQKNEIHYNKIFESCEMVNDYLPYLKKIKQPSLLLVGKYDPACGNDQREYFRKYSRNGTVVEFENSGHFPRLEEPEAYTKAIINFLFKI